MTINLRKLIHQSASEKDREKAIKILARTFYIELRRAGFDETNVITMATEILDALNKQLEKYKSDYKKS